ncbi:SRPBCC family protein [Dyadobacter alkalitolerans]|uniref:SRPBCC family protein n=1 Tax=Dyadobacter alkalitolerans TaxID=492736 RepID=UPI0004027837|nr:SRPBCC domain-containing protein [Dyadobacter alkalitolerans]
MEKNSIVTERIYNAPIEKVWKAITDKAQMKEWYFDLSEFKPEKGFKFSFSGGDDKVQFLHECEILIVEPPKKLAYSWTYPEYEGYSVVTFELFEEGPKQTRLKLTHEGVDSFPKNNPNFAVSSFTGGWDFILGQSLKKYVETEIIQKTISITAPADVIWNIVLNPDNQWGMAFGGGSFVETDWNIGSQVVWLDTDGEVGARGIVKEHRKAAYLQVDMFDDVDADPTSETGEYSEKYSLVDHKDGTCTLSLESGPLAKRYTDEHAGMWENAIKIIKDLSEGK